jgi:hypothetical protein
LSDTPQTPPTPGEQLRSLMDDQGRTYAWLARETGYSESYIFKVIKGGRPWTEAFGDGVQRALGFVPTVVERIHGRYVSLPRNVYERRSELAVDDVAFAEEQGWKDSWLREHAATCLAEGAERAFRFAVAASAPAPSLNAADEVPDHEVGT